mmetsp:Transcript_24589/g.82537  ORF Transcript_24589/g.82537 Transcript_24589/m.82537 type:complete len:280 (-) Transcript_24589:1769-2608(-)
MSATASSGRFPRPPRAPSRGRGRRCGLHTRACQGQRERPSLSKAFELPWASGASTNKVLSGHPVRVLRASHGAGTAMPPPPRRAGRTSSGCGAAADALRGAAGASTPAGRELRAKLPCPTHAAPSLGMRTLPTPPRRSAAQLACARTRHLPRASTFNLPRSLYPQPAPRAAPPCPPDRCAQGLCECPGAGAGSSRRPVEATTPARPHRRIGRQRVKGGHDWTPRRRKAHPLGPGEPSHRASGGSDGRDGDRRRRPGPGGRLVRGRGADHHARHGRRGAA